MAVRFKSEFTSEIGDSYKIEIHDSEWLGGIYDFVVDSRGFELDYSGETDDIVSAVIGSRVSIGAYSNDGFFESFIDSLKSYQENRYRIVIYKQTTQEAIDEYVARVLADGGEVEGTGCLRDAVTELLQGERYFDNSPIQVAEGQYNARVLADGGTLEDNTCLYDAVAALMGLSEGITYSLYWAGWIVQDLITIEDASQPYIYELVATDGLNRLGGIDYTHANDITQGDFGLTRVTDVILNALGDTSMTDLWGTSEAFLETSVDWWESNQTYSSTDDTLYLTALDAALFNSRDDDGNLVYTSSLEVLRQVATLYNSRIFLSNGRWVFEQIGNRATASRYAVQYSKSGTEVATLTIQDDVPLNQTLYGARLAGNQFNFLPALKKVQLTYAQRFLSPWFGAYKFTTGSTIFDAGFIAGGSGIQLALYGPATYTIKSSTGSTSNDIFALTAVYRAQIRVSDSANPGTYYYYNRAFNGYAGAQAFGTSAWSTTAGYYYFDHVAQSVGGGEATLYDINTITTSDLPVTGSLRVTVELYNKYNLQSAAVYTLAAHQTESWNIVFALSRVDDGQEPASGVVYSSNNSSAYVSSNLSLDLGELVIADGATQTGDLVVYNGSAWVAASQWSKGSAGGGTSILKLLTNETLALHASPIQRYDGSVLTSANFEQRLTFGSVAYLRMNGTFTANTDEWTGTLFAIQRTRTNITEIAELPLDRTPVEGRSLGSNPTGGKNELNAGKVAGMSVDVANSSLGPFEEVTGGGKINGFIQLDTAFTPNGESPGGMFWNDDTGTMAVVMADGEFLDTGEKTVWQVKNQSGSTITKGTAVAANGTLGASGRILITPMKGDGTIAAKYFLGLANADIASGDDGYVVSAGKIRQVDTSAFTEGAVLWVHPTSAGELTATEPTAPNLKLPVAFVVYADANGTLAIRQTAGTYLSESHDVKIDSPVSGELLARTGSNVWENVELGTLFNAGTDVPSTEAGESFSQFYGGNSGNVLGEPTKWFRITIGGTDYVIPLYLPA
jgi:hypothetical protein